MTRQSGPTAAEVYERAAREKRLGVWLIARTRIDQTYPCRCSLGKPCNRSCWCRGRTDYDAIPARCCAKPKSEQAETGRAA